MTSDDPTFLRHSAVSLNSRNVTGGLGGKCWKAMERIKCQRNAFWYQRRGTDAHFALKYCIGLTLQKCGHPVELESGDENVTGGLGGKCWKAMERIKC